MAAVLLSAVPASAHPTPFSYVDIRVHGGHVTLTLSAHIVDAAHELDVQAPESLLTVPLPQPAATAFARTLLSRLRLQIDGTSVSCAVPGQPERLDQTQTLRWSIPCADTTAGRALSVDGPLFPYDPEHQTFVNVYVDDALVGQATLDRSHSRASLAIATTPSRLATFRRFLVAGFEHILAGPDHLLFLAGLLLAGGSFKRLAAIVTAFTVAHSVTLGLSVLDVIAPPPRVIEPLIALSIVYVGLRNLRPATGRDWRVISAGSFGLIHGFGFAFVLREMQLPRRDLAWSLLSFNLGVEAGQLAVVLVAALVLAGVYRSGLITRRRLVTCGALTIAAAGSVWFVERILALWR